MLRGCGWRRRKAWTANCPRTPRNSPRASIAWSCRGWPNTTLADLFMPFRFGDLSSAVRASLRSWLNDEIDDGLAHGRQARLGRGAVGSFFFLPLVRDVESAGRRKRSWASAQSAVALPRIGD